MKKQFISRRFSDDSMRIIDAAEKVMNRYASDGFDLSLRQLYYQFIAADLFPFSWIDEEYNRKNGLPADTKNTEKNYKNLGGIISDARLAGLLDWDMIRDRGRELIDQPHWDSPSQIVRGAARQFRIEKWATQPNHIEVMVEKQALEGILIPVCQILDVSFIANKGYSSSSALYEAGRRMHRKIQEGKQVHVIYLGDHDPSGIDMSRDVTDRLTQFAEADEDKLIVHRVALNMDQVRKLKPPRNPAKITDSRAAGYIERFGRDSWELDAIEPKKLSELVQREVHMLRDADTWDVAVEKEDAMRAELQKFADSYDKKHGKG